MHRIDTQHREQDKFGAGKDGFTEGTIGSDPPTETTDDWFDGVQEEIIAPIEGIGIPLVKNTRNQFHDAIKALVARNLVLGSWDGLYNSAAGPLNAIHCDPTLNHWVAVGDALGATPYILHSVNGTDWYRGGSAVRTGPKNIQLNAIGCNGSRWVAMGPNDGADTYTLTSDDGETWTERANTFAGTVNDVIWGTAQSLFVTACENDYYNYSSDGITWTTAGGGTRDWKAIAYGNSRFVMCGASGYATFSDNGTTTWFLRSTGATNTLWAITHSPLHDRFCAVGDPEADNIPAIFTSDDGGDNWTRRTTGLLASNHALKAVKWLDYAQMFIAAGYEDRTHEMYASFDGITWQNHHLLSNQNDDRADAVNAIAENPNNGLVVCCGEVWGATMATLFKAGPTRLLAV